MSEHTSCEKHFNNLALSKLLLVACRWPTCVDAVNFITFYSLRV